MSELHLRENRNGKPQLSFSLDTARIFRGELVYDRHLCVSVGQTASFIHDNFKCGDLICLYGELQNYDDGTSVVAVVRAAEMGEHLFTNPENNHEQPAHL